MVSKRPLFKRTFPHLWDYTFDGHAGASPSGAERWLNCTASLEQSARFLESLTVNQQYAFAGGSTAARQGTTAHAVAETEMAYALGHIDFGARSSTLTELAVMPEAEAEAYSTEMAEHVTMYTDLLKQFIDERGVENVLVEQRVGAVIDLSDGSGEQHVITGSADAIVLPTKTYPSLVVVDFKYGEGIDVPAEENPQMRLYGHGALALLHDFPGSVPWPETIDYYIVQPRNGGIKHWAEPVSGLMAWIDGTVAPALTAALNGVEGGATYSPSDETCMWCPAKGSCPALTQLRMDSAADLFDVITEAEMNKADVNPTALDNDRLGAVLTQVTDLVKMAEELKAEAQRRLFRGETVPGWHLVGYQAPRRWNDGADSDLKPEHHAAPGLTAEAAEALWKEPSLVTPKQALAILAANGYEQPEQVLGSLIDTPEQRPVIARDTDRRKPWTGVPPEQMFPETE